MKQLEEVEKRLWTGADTLRANSNFASNEYFLPVMGLIFLRYAHSRFLKVKGEIEANLPTRGGRRRALTKEDFSRKGAIFLREKSQFDYLVERPVPPASLPRTGLNACETLKPLAAFFKGVATPFVEQLSRTRTVLT